MSWTSKCRMLSVRRPASRTTANASGSRSSSVSPAASRSRNSAVLRAELFVGKRLNLRFFGVDFRDERLDALQLAVVCRADNFCKECVD